MRHANLAARGVPGVRLLQARANCKSGMNRHLSRTIAMQSLYEWDFRPKIDVATIVERNIAEYHTKVDEDYVNKTVAGAILHHDTIDEKLIEAAPEWPIEQVAGIDKSILRLAIYEILYNNEMPPKVAINEAVELAKAYGGENSSKFVNGVLGTIYRNSDRYEDEQTTPEQPIPELKK